MLDICAICYEEMNIDIYELSCNHIFHYKCLYEYLNEVSNNFILCLCKFTCPICRNQFNKYTIHDILYNYLYIIKNKTKDYNIRLYKNVLHSKYIKFKILLQKCVKNHYKQNIKKNIRNYIYITNEIFKLKIKINHNIKLEHHIYLTYNKCLLFDENICIFCEN